MHEVAKSTLINNTNGKKRSNVKLPDRTFETTYGELQELILKEEHAYSGNSKGPGNGFSYKGMLRPRQMGRLTGVSALDYVKCFPHSVLLNFGAFMTTTYPTVPLQLARDEQHVISISSMVNGTVLKQPSPSERVNSLSGLNVYNKLSYCK